MTPDQPQPTSLRDAPAVDKKSRKVYVLWAIALTLLLALGLFSWLVVVPVWQACRIAQKCSGMDLPGHTSPQEGVMALGGQERAARWLPVCRRLPDWMADSQVKIHSIQMLGYCGEAGARELGIILDGKNRHHRLVALEGMGTLGADVPEALSRVLVAVKDSDEGLRMNAVGILTRMETGDKRIAQAILLAAQDPSPAVRRNAIIGLFWMGSSSKQAVAALKQLRGDPDKSVGSAATEALQKIKAAQEKKK